MFCLVSRHEMSFNTLKLLHVNIKGFIYQHDKYITKYSSLNKTLFVFIFIFYRGIVQNKSFGSILFSKIRKTMFFCFVLLINKYTPCTSGHTNKKQCTSQIVISQNLSISLNTHNSLTFH